MGHENNPDKNDTTWDRKFMSTDDNAAENEEGGGEAIGAGAGALGGAGVGDQAEEETEEDHTVDRKTNY